MYKVLQYVGDPRNSDGQLTVNASQHEAAISGGKSNAHGRALIAMLKGWEDYARAYHARYDDPEAKPETNQLDHVIGPYWVNVGLAIKRLLDGDTGGLDCGSIARNITAAIEAEGFETDGYNLVTEDE